MKPKYELALPTQEQLLTHFELDLNHEELEPMDFTVQQGINFMKKSCLTLMCILILIFELCSDLVYDSLN